MEYLEVETILKSRFRHQAAVDFKTNSKQLSKQNSKKMNFSLWHIFESKNIVGTCGKEAVTDRIAEGLRRGFPYIPLSLPSRIFVRKSLLTQTLLYLQSYWETFIFPKDLFTPPPLWKQLSSP
ncbi:hypothetical protein AVEN_214113-1 [Araneus ventricosus]|uniref:Uncharacterized protein n=1 Tax=Araneus ventricosus TaxID=182803 RepID=A0A4Y2C793_ARAVE|nr:hypothetical protein AVEN_214113-1 [Araneus ventricosus]